MGINNTALLSITAATIIAIMLMGMLVMQGRHRQRAAAREQLHNLNTQYRKLNNVLRSLPDAYLSTELRDFIYQALLQNLRSQMKLSPEQDRYLKDEHEQLSVEREHARKRPQPKAIDPNLSAEETNLHRHTLKALYLFIKRNYETGRLDRANAEKMLWQVEIKLLETALNFFRSRGEQAVKSENFREARTVYQKALDTISASRHADQFKQEEIEIRNQLNNVMAQWREHRKEQSSGQAGKLADEMENLIEEQDSWKKKNVYD